MVFATIVNTAIILDNWTLPSSQYLVMSKRTK